MDERIIKYCQGELDQCEEKDLLEEAFNNPSLKKQIVEYQLLYSLVGLRDSAADLRIGKIKYGQFKHRMDWLKRKRLFLRWGQFAAVFVIAVLFSWIMTYYYPQSTGEEVIAMQQELHVPAGQRAELTLPDGTKVWLNAGSRLLYPSVFKGERKVYLTGEGYFSVAKNKKMPFIVSTQTINIKALGTKFNVFSYPKNVHTEVSLQEGSVKAYFPEAESNGLVLSPGQLLVQNGNEFELKEIDSDELLWKKGIYAFRKQKLRTIIEKLELYFSIDIVVQDQEILDYEYVGKFRQRDGVMTILQVIQEIHHFKIEKDNELDRIILSK